MPGAGQFNEQITIERFSSTENSLNEPIRTWSELATVTAECRYVSDGERLAAEQVSAGARARFKVYHTTITASVTGKDRIQFDNRIWNIVDNSPLSQGFNRYRQITAVCKAD